MDILDHGLPDGADFIAALARNVWPGPGDVSQRSTPLDTVGDRL